MTWKNLVPPFFEISPKKKLDQKLRKLRPDHQETTSRTPSFGFGSAGRDGAVASWVTNWGCDPIRGNFGTKKAALDQLFPQPFGWIRPLFFVGFE